MILLWLHILSPVVASMSQTERTDSTPYLTFALFVYSLDLVHLSLSSWKFFFSLSVDAPQDLLLCQNWGRGNKKRVLSSSSRNPERWYRIFSSYYSFLSAIVHSCMILLCYLSQVSSKFNYFMFSNNIGLLVWSSLLCFWSLIMPAVDNPI